MKKLTILSLLFCIPAAVFSQTTKDSLKLKRDLESIKNGNRVHPLRHKSLVVLTDTVPLVDSNATKPVMPVHAAPHPNNPNPHNPRPVVVNPNMPPTQKDSGKRGSVNKKNI